MPSTIPLTQDVLESIQRHLGKATADMYARAYASKDQRAILLSLREILKDVIGESKAEEELSVILQKHHVAL